MVADAPSRHCILIRGSNDVASAVAHRLFLAGAAAVLHEGRTPAVTRRKMSFADAVFDGQAVLAGVAATRLDSLDLLPDILAARERIPVAVVDLVVLLNVLAPDVLVDARMRKRDHPEPQRGLAAFTVGLGPGFVAGETVDAAIETSWGDLGRVIEAGPTRPLAGEPRPIGGHARDRYVYAPRAGLFRSDREIGDAVTTGDLVAHVDELPLSAPLPGLLRGLTRSGIPVGEGTKVIEVDPRGAGAVVAGIGERPARIAEGVLLAVEGWASR